MREYVGLKPTTPQNEAGCRTEPPVSEPMEAKQRSACTATAEPPEEPAWYTAFLVNWLPLLLLLGVWIFVMRQMQGGGAGKAMSFGRSRARMLNEDSARVTFDDVAGVDEAKEELTEIVDFLKDLACHGAGVRQFDAHADLLAALPGEYECAAHFISRHICARR